MSQIITKEQFDNFVKYQNCNYCVLKQQCDKLDDNYNLNICNIIKDSFD